ncbi:unnamed protein product [Mytilus edulis]|uniref:CCHC-type domain-containing protein n=1 Tax=Mytilus edulis TaxID=6550 RepID=A0A8S3UPT9_MYTED|nr:unnamed protein product [Mytilus edulis]
MDSEGEPDISLRTVLTAVNQQSKDIEAIIDAKVTEKIGGLREELQGANQLMKSQVKKLKTDASYKWKYEGNKIQFDFNTENLEDLVQTLWAIDNGKVDYARDLLSSTVDKIKHRNKLIKIADTSEGGWDTARQYDANPIASDSEDEAKIIRADNRAVRKKKGKSKQVRGNGSKTKASNQSLLGQAPNFVPQPFRGPQQPWFNGIPLQQGFNAGKTQRGQCYSCGSYAHYRSSCPYVNSSKPATQTRPQ